MTDPAHAGSSITIDYIADLACPWCYIGLRRFAQARAMRPAHRVASRWRPFMLNPNLPAEGMDRATYMRAKFGSEAAAERVYGRIVQAGEAEGIPFDFGRMKRTPNTLQAHRLILFAQARGKAEVLIERLFCALFIEGKDVGDLRVLVKEAAAAGLEPKEVGTWLAGRELADEVVHAHETAQWQGVRGVPAFVLADTHAITGAQPAEVLTGLIDVAAHQSSSPH
jgi:predicted DsbA family dithiol-disulfide isomerase